MRNIKAHLSRESMILATILFILIAILIPCAVKGAEIYRLKKIERNLAHMAQVGTAYLKDSPEKSLTYQVMKKKKLIDEIDPVAGETYDALIVNVGGGILTVRTLIGLEVSYKY